jgi:hypothetical protein
LQQGYQTLCTKTDGRGTSKGLYKSDEKSARLRSELLRCVEFTD